MRRTGAGVGATRGTGVLAVIVAVLALLLVFCGVVLAATTAGWDHVYLDEPVAGVALAVVGGLLASRVPRNPIGWLFLIGGCGGAIATAANAFAAAAQMEGVVAHRAVLALGGSLWIAPFLVLGPLLLLFPDGRLRSRRWRPALVAAIAGGVVTVTIFIVAGASGGVEGGMDLPLPVVAIMVVATLLVAGSLLAGLAHLLVRFRTARGDERQQLRWLLAGGVATCAFIGLGTTNLDADYNDALWALALLPIPAATGVAVLRYRLYDLGRLVSRTVVYGVLTAALLGIYLVLVTAAALVTPAGRTSPLAVAASTLAAAALFRPLRARVQEVVDRRFNRARYDATRVVQEFRSQVREVVDLDTVGEGLINATSRTVQPAAATLWLREAAR